MWNQTKIEEKALNYENINKLLKWKQKFLMAFKAK